MIPGPVSTGAPLPTVFRFVTSRTANTTGRYPCRYCCWSIANSILPCWISLIAPPTSNVPIFVPLGHEGMQGIVTSGSRPRNESRLLSALKAALTLALVRSEEHTSELQSRPHLVCRLLLVHKKH